jgi:serine/threonine-protein kinase
VGSSGGIPRLTLSDLADNKIPANQLRDRVLIIGRGSMQIRSPSLTTESLGEALGQRYASLMDGNNFVMPRLSRLLQVLLLLGSIVFAAIYAPNLPTGRRLAVTAVACFGLVLIETLLLATLRLWVPLLGPALALATTTLLVSLTPLYTGKTARLGTSTIATWARTLPRREAKRPVVPAKPAQRTASGQAQTPPGHDNGEYSGAAMTLREISDNLKASQIEPTPSEVADLLLGRSKRRPKPRLGRYELDRELGRGAMGTVFLARDPRINRIVALKAIPIVEEFADNELDEARKRFFREAEMAGRLNHPGIVTVHDAGEDNGIAWIAMEHVDGTLLSDFSSSDRLLPPAQVLEIIARAADALDYAHAQDVIHRDIKPANIIFIPETLETKLTDFGIARLTNSSSTRSGIVLGTPSFMAPEQLDGRTVTGFSDIFALGVTLFQLLTGQLPFRADSMTALMDKIAHAEPPPLRTIRPDLPDCCAAIITQALAKSPTARFASAGDMARALRACARTLKA